MRADAAFWAAIGFYFALRLLCFLAAIVLCLRASQRGTEFEAQVKSLSLTLMLRTGGTTDMSAGRHSRPFGRATHGASGRPDLEDGPLEATHLTKKDQESSKTRSLSER